jgi:hypothetical protein
MNGGVEVAIQPEEDTEAAMLEDGKLEEVIVVEDLDPVTVCCVQNVI